MTEGKTTEKIRWLIVAALLLIAMRSACGEVHKMYSADLGYANRTLYLSKLLFMEGYASDRMIQPENGYLCRVVSSDGRTLESFRFEPSPTVCYDYFDPAGNMTGGCHTYDNANLTLSIQYFEDAKSVDFLSPEGRLLLSVDVSKYSENSAGSTIARQTNEQEKETKGGNPYNTYLYAAGSVLLLITVALLLKKTMGIRRKNK